MEPGGGNAQDLAAEDLDTAKLVERAQGGDEAAFTAIYKRYVDRVYGYMRVALKDRHEAEDAAQQVFTSVFEKLGEFEPRPGKPFRAWLFTIVRNQAISSLRSAHREELRDPAELDAMRAEEAVEDEVLIDALDWIADGDLLLFVRQLPLAQRQILLLRFFADMSVAQTATTLGRTETDVSVTQSRALRFLRERLTAVGRAPEEPAKSNEGTVDRSSMERGEKKAHVLRRRRFALID